MAQRPRRAIFVSRDICSRQSRMTEDNPKVEAALEGLDESKRSTLKVLFGTSAFMPPLVLSFAMADLSIDAFVYATTGNYTTTLPVSTTRLVTTTGSPGTT